MKTTDAQMFSIKRGISVMEGYLKRPMSTVESSIYAWAFVDGAMFEEKEIKNTLNKTKRKGNQ